MLCSVASFSVNAASLDDFNLYDAPSVWHLAHNYQGLSSEPPNLGYTDYYLVDSAGFLVAPSGYVDVPMDFANIAHTSYSIVVKEYPYSVTGADPYAINTDTYMYGYPLTFGNNVPVSWSQSLGAFWIDFPDDGYPNSGATFSAGYAQQKLRANTLYAYSVVLTNVRSDTKFYFRESDRYTIEEQYSTSSTSTGQNVSRGLIRIGSAATSVKDVVGTISNINQTAPGMVIDTFAFAPVAEEIDYNDVLNQIEQNTEKTNQTIKDQFKVNSGDLGQINDAGGMGTDAVENVNALQLADTISTGFFDLFSSDDIGDPVLTFPAFSIEVDGVTYDVWDDMEYNLNELEKPFSVLLAAVRFGTVGLCYFKLIEYLHRVYEKIFMQSVGGSD